MMMLRSSAVVFELLLFLAATLCPHPAKAFVGTGTAAPNRGWVGSSHSEKKRVASQGVGFGSGRPFDIGAISPLPSAPSTRDLAQALRGSEVGPLRFFDDFHMVEVDIYVDYRPDYQVYFI